MLNRREFVATGIGGVAGLGAGLPAGATTPDSPRAHFPRLDNEVYVNAAAGTPLGSFAEEGIRRYNDLIRLGPADGRRAYFNEVLAGVRGSFAGLIGANESEIGFAHCTKAGEQIAIDGLEALRADGNIVTNDLHFAGSLHNYVGLQRTGVDVRIVRSRELHVTLERMAEAIDSKTALVAVSLVSNVNGHVEPIAELARLAHDRGALLFADIIQAAGIVPIDVHSMGIDVAACSSYKWLFGIHGAGFLYVSDVAQGAALKDYLFPGHARRNYPPFAVEIDPSADDFTYRPPADATRYQPGHVNYLGYCAVYEGMKFIAENGGPAKLLEHSVRLNRYLVSQLDPDDFQLLSTDLEESPILTLAARRFEDLRDRLMASNVVISIGGDKWDQLRISPAIYNTEADMDRVAEVLRGW